MRKQQPHIREVQLSSVQQQLELSRGEHSTAAPCMALGGAGSCRAVASSVGIWGG